MSIYVIIKYKGVCGVWRGHKGAVRRRPVSYTHLAGVRIDPENPVCAEGLANGFFCTKADGTPFVAAVWPGKAYFADFLRPEVREWFGRQYKALTDCGIEGFWNDMNEPAPVSYTHLRTCRRMLPSASASRSTQLTGSTVWS